VLLSVVLRQVEVSASREQKAQVLIMLPAYPSLREIATQFGVNKTAIHRHYRVHVLPMVPHWI
jgi:DNA-binding transcriptional regulator YhcF (GntR family)